MQTLDWILDSLNFLEFFQLLSRLGEAISTRESPLPCLLLNYR